MRSQPRSPVKSPRRRNLDKEIFEKTRSVYLDMQSSPASRNLSVLQSKASSKVASRRSLWEISMTELEEINADKIDGNK
jgi:hypothetical protein